MSDNIVKKVCKELGLTKDELIEAIKEATQRPPVVELIELLYSHGYFVEKIEILDEARIELRLVKDI